MNRYLGLAIILGLFANTAAASATQDGKLSQTAPDSGATEQTQLLKAIDAFPLFTHESSGATLRLPSNPMRMEKAAPGGEAIEIFAGYEGGYVFYFITVEFASSVPVDREFMAGFTVAMLQGIAQSMRQGGVECTTRYEDLVGNGDHAWHRGVVVNQDGTAIYQLRAQSSGHRVYALAVSRFGGIDGEDVATKFFATFAAPKAA